MQLLHYTLQYTYLLYTSFSRKTDPTDFEFNCFFLKKKKIKFYCGTKQYLPQQRWRT
jgi:hypothetical protein